MIHARPEARRYTGNHWARQASKGAEGPTPQLGSPARTSMSCSQLLPERPDTEALNEVAHVLREYSRSGTGGTDDREASHAEIKTPDEPESGGG